MTLTVLAASHRGCAAVGTVRRAVGDLADRSISE